jgi:hypothetical protein
LFFDERTLCAVTTAVGMDLDLTEVGANTVLLLDAIDDDLQAAAVGKAFSFFLRVSATVAFELKADAGDWCCDGIVSICALYC